MPKILIVEHVDSLARLHKVALLREGHQVITARDAVEAIQSFETESPQLVVLNLSLQWTNGFVSLMRFFDRHPDIPIVVHTGGVGRNEPEWPLMADARLVNSADTDQLRTMVRKLLDRGPTGEVVPFAKPSARRRR